jgi:hypothetical protein
MVMTGGNIFYHSCDVSGKLLLSVVFVKRGKTDKAKVATNGT